MCFSFVIFKLLESIFFFFHIVPSVAPLSFNGTDSSSSSLNISWDTIPQQYHEGILLGYNISYHFINGSLFEDRGGSLVGYLFCNGSQSTYCDVTGLNLNTNYSIKVAGVIGAGNGVRSEELEVKTGYFG